MQCKQCYRFFPRKPWPPTRAGMVAFVGQKRMAEMGYLPPRYGYSAHRRQLSPAPTGMPLMDGLEDDDMEPEDDR